MLVLSTTWHWVLCCAIVLLQSVSIISAPQERNLSTVAEISLAEATPVPRFDVYR